MFARIYSNYRLSIAAVIVHNLLEMHGDGTETGRNAGVISNRLVAEVYERNPALFDGKLGKRPHKFSVAAVALAHGTDTMRHDVIAQLYYHLSLGTILLEIAGKPQKYALSSLDHEMLGAAQDAYLANVR